MIETSRNHKNEDQDRMTLQIDRARLSPQSIDGQLANILVPSYDRSSVSAGIAHFGVGNFHCAHQALYLDRLLDQAEANSWGILRERLINTSH